MNIDQGMIMYSAARLLTIAKTLEKPPRNIEEYRLIRESLREISGELLKLEIKPHLEKVS